MSLASTIQLAPPLPTERHLLDADQVAEKIGCSTRMVYKLCVSGRMPEGVRIGRLRRWDSAVIDAWITAGCGPLRRSS